MLSVYSSTFRSQPPHPLFRLTQLLEEPTAESHDRLNCNHTPMVTEIAGLSEQSAPLDSLGCPERHVLSTVQASGSEQALVPTSSLRLPRKRSSSLRDSLDSRGDGCGIVEHQEVMGLVLQEADSTTVEHTPLPLDATEPPESGKLKSMKVFSRSLDAMEPRKSGEFSSTKSSSRLLDAGEAPESGELSCTKSSSSPPEAREAPESEELSLTKVTADLLEPKDVSRGGELTAMKHFSSSPPEANKSTPGELSRAKDILDGREDKEFPPTNAPEVENGIKIVKPGEATAYAEGDQTVSEEARGNEEESEMFLGMEESALKKMRFDMNMIREDGEVIGHRSVACDEFNVSSGGDAGENRQETAKTETYKEAATGQVESEAQSESGSVCVSFVGVQNHWPCRVLSRNSFGVKLICE